MRNAFSFEGPFFTSMSRVADIIWLNILFLICSLPIFTIGASATAMYYVTLKMVRDEESYITKSFFKSFKENFLQATGIWIILVVVGMVITMDLKIVSNEAYAGIITSEAVRNVIMIASMMMFIILSGIVVYVFPILAKFENTVKRTIINAFLMAIRHLPKTAILILITAVPLILMYFYVQLFLIVFFVFSTIAYFSSKILVKIFDNYIPKETEADSKEVNNEEA